MTEASLVSLGWELGQWGQGQFLHQRCLVPWGNKRGGCVLWGRKSWWVGPILQKSAPVCYLTHSSWGMAGPSRSNSQSFYNWRMSDSWDNSLLENSLCLNQHLLPRIKGERGWESSYFLLTLEGKKKAGNQKYPSQQLSLNGNCCVLGSQMLLQVKCWDWLFSAPGSRFSW